MSRGAAVRALAWVILLVIPAALAGPVAGSSYAQPGDPGAQTSAAPGVVTLRWPTLGLQSNVDLYGDGNVDFTVPLPMGLTATRLQGMIHTPTNISAGYVEIADGDGKFLASVDLPSAAPGVAMVPFDVDIAAARVRDSSVDLTFTTRATEVLDRNCGPTQHVMLSDLATVFAGTQLPPTTIANFFPTVLQKVTIYSPTDANSAEQEAVLTLTSTLERIYSPQPLSIAVVSQPRGALPPPAPDLERAVVVETGQPGLSVENVGTPAAYLRVSGDGEKLSAQVSLLATRLQPLAQSATARVDQAGADSVLSGDTLTFSQLEAGGRSTSFLKTSTLGVSFDRTKLGPRFDGIQVHLLADYTPVPARDAASVVIRAGQLVVYRAPLDQSGRLDATFDLDSQVLDQQFINLQLALTYTPDQPCGPLVSSMTFQIDPRSTLTMHRGGPPLGGFGAFPSEFSPQFLVALDGSSPDQLSYAARVVAAIARLTSTELTPKVVDLQTAVSASSGALIVANSAAITQTSLNPPVSGDGSSINFELPTALRVNISDGLGSIQAFADPPRNRSVVLVTTTTQWGLVDRLFSYIDGSVEDWGQLTGDVLAAGAGGTVANVSIRPASNVFEPASSAGAARWIKVAGAAAVVATIAVIAGALYFGRRRTRRAQGPSGAHSTGD
ncbi:hypothetical protein MycrhN_1279 [Mycolicibacterium rhodesiae NBB3]|uniref:Cellulose synthase subunit n=1 Tax=Mycolicibacterium rhodesiae (strain NBB3) TaxID=710685 RepID=G8RX43_MYCRN|nr:hypothetical protein [Mycolicibacterium rhodesiae]AEV71900.1 hypothetical protein MycrhN_1279 [Mycolicibacterium rhodesiae NBB3]